MDGGWSKICNASFRPEDKVMFCNPAAIAELVGEPAGTTEVSDGGMG